ncbi:hypothetical protein QYE76_069735 [Lolium multiflorum]|uniref:Uncharacterized protein n=1 Tax=Lolium multiflorum TaxID=4521 RepID=A0AAD8SJB3_LOLMU|nr:hypothetical protein QYE76_069735 [Lolium multiflorum]
MAMKSPREMIPLSGGVRRRSLNPRDGIGGGVSGRFSVSWLSNPSKEIFSKLDEIKAHDLIFPRSFRNRRDTRGEHRGPTRRGGAAKALGAPPDVAPPGPSELPFRLLKDSSQNPRGKATIRNLPSRRHRSQDLGDRVSLWKNLSLGKLLSGVFLDNVLRLGLRVDGILQADTRHRYTDKRGERFTQDLRGVISSLEAFASQFTSLEADKIRLQEEAKSSSSKLEGAIKKAAVARQEVDSLKEELNKLKERLKEEEARAAEKDELLRQSALALLEAADIPATALDKIPSNSPANGVSTVLTAHQLTRGLLDKGKGALARMHSMIFPKATQEKTLGQLIDAFGVDTKEVIEVFPVPSFVDDSSGVLPESDRIQRMKDRIAQMEKDLRSTYALAAIINKKSETAADVERYALTELHKATESLNFIALNRAEESKRVHERVNALIELSSAEEIFWREHSKASAVAQFQDRVQQVHHFFDKCYKAMRVVWKTMFPLNAVPPTLLALMSEFGNAKKIRDLVRAQVFAGARFTLALVLARYPSAGLLSIANVTGDLEALYPKVLLPANIIVDRLEKDSKVPEEKGTPQG